jgi:hypothetical protein
VLLEELFFAFALAQPKILARTDNFTLIGIALPVYQATLDY